MFRLGLNAFAYTDNHMQAIAAAHTDKNSVVIGISHSGQSKDVIDSVAVAKKNGATTIALTSQNKSALAKVSDVVLCTVSDETNYRILGLSSRIAQLTIIDALYSYLVCNIDNVEEKIDKTELALREKKL
jgi:DNA-binding MurR/RpiR family transcriptional regulator